MTLKIKGNPVCKVTVPVKGYIQKGNRFEERVVDTLTNPVERIPIIGGGVRHLKLAGRTVKNDAAKTINKFGMC